MAARAVALSAATAGWLPLPGTGHTCRAHRQQQQQQCTQSCASCERCSLCHVLSIAHIGGELGQRGHGDLLLDGPLRPDVHRAAVLRLLRGEQGQAHSRSELGSRDSSWGHVQRQQYDQGCTTQQIDSCRGWVEGYGVAAIHDAAFGQGIVHQQPLWRGVLRGHCLSCVEPVVCGAAAAAAEGQQQAAPSNN
jgi:hypothetical protein